MTEFEQKDQQIQSTMIICNNCQSEQFLGQKYCTNCGKPLIGETKKTSPAFSSGSSPGSRGDDKYGKHIKWARYAILFVAVLTIVAAGLQWYNLKIEEEYTNYGFYTMHDYAVDARNQAQIRIVFFLGMVFLGLFFWAKSRPFAATLTALILYLTNLIVSFGINPKSLIDGLWLKIIIIAALVNGLKSALLYKKDKEIAARTA
jgi:ABC-type Fe3+-siderophore transport system permease subunit